MYFDLYDEKDPIRFLCWYIPPIPSRDQNTITYICQIIRDLIPKNRPIYIFGDFNLPDINWSIPSSVGNSAHTSFLTFCLSRNLEQCIEVPTHNKGNILDLLLCNDLAYNNLLCFSVEPPLSHTCDHSLISFKTQLKNRKKSNTPNYKIPNFPRANYSQINDELNAINWNHLIASSADFPSFYNKFISILNESINRLVPLRKFHKPSRRPRHIKTLLKQKKNAYRQYKSDKSLKKLFKQKSKKYDLAVKDWFNKIESNICKNPSSKKFYNYVNNKIKSRSSIPSLYDEENNLQISDIDKATLFNSFFQKVFVKDNGQTLNVPNKTTAKMASFEITFLDILQAINGMKDKITRTPEGIPMYFIKRIISSILYPLHFIFNSSLNLNFIPDQWKCSIVVPVFKKGNRSMPENYRPISLTSSFCRIFESILFKKMLSHLQSNNLLSPKQFGFIPQRSACSQLLTCIHQWLISLSSNRTSTVIYTDISKAFDSVPHSKLVQVLISYGINATLVSWLSNFLRNRKQQVAIGEALSAPLLVHSGVPQGSVIGPLLFLIYINDIIQCSRYLNNTGDILLFADDTKLYSTDVNSLQSTLNYLSQWTESRQLKLAPHKCASLQISKPSNKSPCPTLSIQNTPLPYTSSFKDLGIYISSDLKWTDHIFFVFKQASLVSYQILKTFKTNNINILLKLYITYLRPKVEHNSPIWSPWLKKDINKIESIQRCFTRQAFLRSGIPFTSYSDRLIKLNLKSLQYRRVVFDLILIFKIINGLSDLHFDDYFIFRSIPYSFRGNNRKIDTKYKSKDPQWSNSFFSRITSIWNSIPDHISSCSSLRQFKFKLKNFDLCPYFNEIIN